MEHLGAVSGTTDSAGVWQDPNNPWILQGIFSRLQDFPEGSKWLWQVRRVCRAWRAAALEIALADTAGSRPLRAGESANNGLSKKMAARKTPGETSQASLPSILSVRIISRGNVSDEVVNQRAPQRASSGARALRPVAAGIRMRGRSALKSGNSSRAFELAKRQSVLGDDAAALRWEGHGESQVAFGQDQPAEGASPLFLAAASQQPAIMYRSSKRRKFSIWSRRAAVGVMG